MTVAGNLATLTVALILSGCAVGPDFQVPIAPAVDRITTQSLTGQTVASAALGGA